jgi:hypothetical protein
MTKTMPLLYALCVLLGNSACTNGKQGTVNFDTNVSFSELAGVWGMSDPKMTEFLNLSNKNAYCMEVRPSERKARIRFLFSDKTYEVKIEQTGKGRFKIARDSKQREARVVKHSPELASGVIYYWHFSDSMPFPNKNNSSDGVKENFETINEAVKAAEKEEESTPLNEGNPYE